MADENKIARLAEIQEQIKTLAEEGMKIADEQQVIFSLADAPFTEAWGSGGMEYIPEGDEVRDEWGEEPYGDRGWSTSNSQGC